MSSKIPLLRDAKASKSRYDSSRGHGLNVLGRLRSRSADSAGTSTKNSGNNHRCYITMDDNESIEISKPISSSNRQTNSQDRSSIFPKIFHKREKSRKANPIPLTPLQKQVNDILSSYEPGTPETVSSVRDEQASSLTALTSGRSVSPHQDNSPSPASGSHSVRRKLDLPSLDTNKNQVMEETPTNATTNPKTFIDSIIEHALPLKTTPSTTEEQKPRSTSALRKLIDKARNNNILNGPKKVKEEKKDKKEKPPQEDENTNTDEESLHDKIVSLINIDLMNNTSDLMSNASASASSAFLDALNWVGYTTGFTDTPSPPTGTTSSKMDDVVVPRSQCNPKSTPLRDLEYLNGNESKKKIEIDDANNYRNRNKANHDNVRKGNITNQKRIEVEGIDRIKQQEKHKSVRNSNSHTPVIDETRNNAAMNKREKKRELPYYNPAHVHHEPSHTRELLDQNISNCNLKTTDLKKYDGTRNQPRQPPLKDYGSESSTEDGYSTDDDEYDEDEEGYDSDTKYFDSVHSSTISYHSNDTPDTDSDTEDENEEDLEYQYDDEDDSIDNDSYDQSRDLKKMRAKPTTTEANGTWSEFCCFF